MQGMMGVFRELDAATETVRALRAEKINKITAYTPTPRHEFEEAFGDPPSNVRKFTLIGGLLGATFGWWIAIWCSDYWPLVVGGKAIASWVPYTIFCFEVMVLIGGLSTVFGLFGLVGIPRLVTTVGYDERFSQGNYGIFAEGTQDQMRSIEDTMRRNGAVEVRGAR
jgi:ActD protein